MKIAYENKNFQGKTLRKIQQADAIIREYQEAGFSLTVRQLYYQFVARNLIPNNERSYKKLGQIINDARMCGHLDWEAIEDRTRSLRKLPSWESPKEIIETCAKQYKTDLWKDQDYRLEVWIEKDALVGIIDRVCDSFRVPYFSCRGYSSQSAMWRAGQRILGYKDENKKTIIIHLGDHDPSGIDMTRDIEERLSVFLSRVIMHDLPLIIDDTLLVNRIALNIEQVRQYNPPPNPAKISDSRYEGYVEEYGPSPGSWMHWTHKFYRTMVENEIKEYIDFDRWDESEDKEASEAERIQEIAENFK